MAFLLTSQVEARASLECELPAVFSLAVEQRQMLDAGGAGLVVVRAPARSSLRAGDIVRQVNGRRTSGCADLEAAAAEALAKGLVLLVAAERDGRLLAAALPGSTGIAVAEAPAQASTASETTAGAERLIVAPTPTATPVVQRTAALPARGAASAELVAKAVAAAAVLGTVDEAARLAVPLAVYERRLDDARNAIAALRIEGEGGDAVRTVVDEAFGYHEAAREIRRYKASELDHTRVDQRGAGARALPYFSDSAVPRWVERYPFLSASLQQAPRSTHLLLPGEVAGRWNPDQAVELLWERAAGTAARLAAWAATH